MNLVYAVAGEDVFNMEEKKILEALGYKINDRKFPDIKKLFSEDYKRVMPDCKSDEVVYSGAEHNGNPKLPNITILPNIKIPGGIMLGSTMGHQHTQDDKFDLRMFQEVYEFLGYGGMLLRKEKEANLYVLKPGEKVLVGTGDNMTIFNLDEKPLVTLDYANPKMNSANKNLESKIGPSILIKQNTKNVFIKPNKEYYKRKLLQGNSDILTIENAGLGEELHGKIYDYKDKFREKGINLIIGGNIPWFLKEDFSPNLLNIILTQGKRLFEELGIDNVED